MRRASAIILAVACALTLVACGTPSSHVSEPPSAAPSIPSNCITLTEGAVAKLEADIAATVPDAEFHGAGAAASAEGDMWYIAITFTDPGLGRDFTGVWGTMQDPTVNDDIAYVAVDEVAEASGTYLQPVDFDGGIGVQLPGAVAATDCIS